MRTSESVELPASPAAVFEYVARLEQYPQWLRLVHDVDIVGEHPEPAWEVELRARVGPFARSKRLRMQRTELTPHTRVAFERREVDGRQHAMWSLGVDLTPSDVGTTLTMHLAYEGTLWTGGVLQKILDDEVRRARVQLVNLLSPTP